MIKLIYLLSALFIVSTFLSATAYALTTDRDSGMNADGTPKFADPDEQQPDMLAPVPKPPDGMQNKNNLLGSSPSSSSDSPHFSITAGSNGSSQKQQDPFDHAYSHLGQ